MSIVIRKLFSCLTPSLSYDKKVQPLSIFPATRYVFTSNMILFALFTVGYFLGVFTALAIFPPWVKEIEEQEADSIIPLQSIPEDKRVEQAIGYEQPAVIS